MTGAGAFLAASISAPEPSCPREATFGPDPQAMRARGKAARPRTQATSRRYPRSGWIGFKNEALLSPRGETAASGSGPPVVTQPAENESKWRALMPGARSMDERDTINVPAGKLMTDQAKQV